MGLVQITGQVIRTTGQNTTNLLNQAIQFTDGQNELRKIQADQKDSKRERSYKRQSLEDVKKMQDQAREVEELKSKLRRAEHKNEVLRDLAADVILDRSSIIGALNFLKSKWARPGDVKEFESDTAAARTEEKAKIEQDDERQNKAYQLVDNVVNSWSHSSSTRRRRPPAVKNKAPSPK